uniref:Putative methyltransferase n=1 Tax=viral metagenome TaxID=1070528 RepID=A0A6M3KAT9_9ZZZZ
MAESDVYNMDCMIGMAGFPDKYFDLAICDPPYGIGVNKMFIAKDRKDPRNGRLIKCNRNKRGNWDNNRPDKSYFIELQRVSKNQIIWGGNYFADLLIPKSCWIVWDKVNGGSDQADCELAWTSFNSAVRQIRYMWCIAQGKSLTDGHIAQGNNKLWEEKIHPTQKPVKLYLWLLKNYAKEGDKIIDTHLGSGSSRIACHEGGFDFVGYEIDIDYFDTSVKRFENYKLQLKLF